jgi:hypothetical protein
VSEIETMYNASVQVGSFADGCDAYARVALNHHKTGARLGTSSTFRNQGPSLRPSTPA